MQSTPIYTRQGKRLLTLKEAQDKGYGLIHTLKQHIRRGKLKGYKVAHIWLVREDKLTRPTKCRPTIKKKAKAS